MHLWHLGMEDYHNILGSQQADAAHDFRELGAGSSNTSAKYFPNFSAFLFQLDMASAILESMHNQSNCMGESSAVIILRRREKICRRFGATKTSKSCQESCFIHTNPGGSHLVRIQSLKELPILRVQSRRRSSL